VKPIDFDLSELLSKMIRLLPEPQQEVVQLTFFEGMSQRQIAAAKCIALGTVKTRLQLAHKKLLNHLVPIQDKVLYFQLEDRPSDSSSDRSAHSRNQLLLPILV
jgi:predicted DNA-binding protein (UPF0251 family)